MTVCQLMSWSSSRCWSWRSCVKSRYLIFPLKVDGQDAISLLIQFVTGVIDGSVDWRGMFLGNSFGVTSVLLCSSFQVLARAPTSPCSGRVRAEVVFGP